jgi:hypothetical protein
MMRSSRNTSVLLILTMGALLAVSACGGADVDEAVFADAGPTPDGGDTADASGGDANDSCATGTAPDMCNFFTGCGCDVAGGDKCTVVGDDRGCGPAGDQLRDTDCTQDGMCELGTVCATYADAQRCMQFCDGAHTCGTGSACFVQVTDSGQMVEGRVCGQICSLLGQDCAGSAQGCYPSAAVLPGVME